MSIEPGNPPRPVKASAKQEKLPQPVRKHKYTKLIGEIVKQDGAWLRVSLDEVAPNRPAAVNQTIIWQASAARGVRVQTTAQYGAVYVRLVKETI